MLGTSSGFFFLFCMKVARDYAFPLPSALSDSPDQMYFCLFLTNIHCN